MHARRNIPTHRQQPRILLLAAALAAAPFAQCQSSTTPSPAPNPPTQTQNAPAAATPASPSPAPSPTTPNAAPAAPSPATSSAPSSAQTGTTVTTETETSQAPHRGSAVISVAEGNKQAWTMLRNAAGSKPDLRIQAVTALGTMTGFPNARKLVIAAFADSDMDVRVAAVVAVQTAKDRSMIPTLRKALDDKSPEVSFAAAAALWRMGNDSGKDILFDVLNGERKSGSSFISSNLHTASKDMHSPATLAAIGAKQGAYMLLGPFGVGLDALDYIRKGNNGNSARVLAITLLSEKRSAATCDQLVAALGDKDAFVRAAAAHALGSYHTRNATDTLLDAFGDSKSAVRLMAAASYIRATGIRSSGNLVASAAKLPAKGAH